MLPHDPIENPSHYTVYPVQQIEISRHLGYCLGNTVKYIMRAPHKNGAEDVRKALQYLKLEKETPAMALHVHDWYVVEAHLNELSQFLKDKHHTQDDAVAARQAGYLDALFSYLVRPMRTSWQRLHDAAKAMLAELENAAEHSRG